MDAESIEGVIITKPAFDLEAEEPGNESGGDADEHRASGTDKAAGGRNDDQAGDSTRAEAQDAGFAAGDPFGHGPDERGDSRGKRGSGKGVGGDDIRADGAAGIEAIPADPQHAGTDHAEDHAMGRHRFFAEADALTQDEAKDKSGPARGHVDDGAAGKINRMNPGVFVENTVHEAVNAPDHVGLGEIDDKHPEGHEETDGGKLHALGDGADDQGGGNDREHELIHGKDVLRNPVGIVGVGAGIDAVQEGISELAKDFATVVEHQAVSADEPKDGDQGGNEGKFGGAGGE